MPLLVEIKSILRLPADRQWIGKIETIMERLLTDKTITLHDLANRGLLQLDQIRSYTTASTANPPSSADDDQRKAHEETLLDECEASKKLSDQHTLSKRLTDTSISAKQPSLAAVRSSKSFSKDRQRKSSLSLEHQYRANKTPPSIATHRRRQTLTESTLSTASSRLLAQASMKKIFKCNSISDLHPFTFSFF